MTGQAYTEQFGLETLQRADNAVRVNKATRQTADTFQAAATFLELSHIWGPIDDDVASKIKFAKYHALRIAKALKAGEDPNMTNPAPEPSPEQQQPAFDPSDPEVQALNGVQSASHISRDLRQPSVEEVPDEHDHVAANMARTPALDQSVYSSIAPSVPGPSAETHSYARPHGEQPLQGTSGQNFNESGTKPDVSPLLPQDNADGGEYFPTVPEGYSSGIQPVLPETPSQRPRAQLSTDFPALPPHPPAETEDFHAYDTQYLTNSTPHAGRPFPAASPSIPRQAPPPQQPSYPSHPALHSSFNQSMPRGVPQAPVASPVSSRVVAQPSAPQRMDSKAAYATDEEAIMKAQKHARWAISALNFEDVNTAVDELRGALNALGAD